MSQYGMQMPGGQLQRGPVMNIYTALLAIAALALLVACVFVFIEGSRIGHEGSAFGLHPYDSSNHTYDVKLSTEGQ